MPDFKLLLLDLQKRLKNDPENSQILSELAIVSMEVNEYEDALKYFKQAAHLNPSVQSLNNLAYFYFKEGEPGEDGGWRYREDIAIDLLEKAIELEPQTHFPYALLGEIYTAKKDYDRAIVLLNKSISIKPTIQNLNNMGVCCYYHSSLEEAYMYFHLASLKRGSKDVSPFPLLSSGISLARLGRMSEAKKVAEELIRFCKETDLFFEEDDVADLYYEIGDYKRVTEVYEGSKLGYSPLWIPSYLYSLERIGDRVKMNEVFDDVIRSAQKDIEDTLIDEDEDWSQMEKQEYIDGLKADLSFYEKSFQNILNGQLPLLDYQPSIESTCYLFGCTRHNNPLYIELD
jgi:tetratricopeptide (TPR) repeat protein